MPYKPCHNYNTIPSHTASHHITPCHTNHSIPHHIPYHSIPYQVAPFIIPLLHTIQYYILHCHDLLLLTCTLQYLVLPYRTIHYHIISSCLTELPYRPTIPLSGLI